MSAQIAEVDPSFQLQAVGKGPLLERPFLIDDHFSQTGWAESHWSYHHAPDRIQPNPLVIVGGYLGAEIAYLPVAAELAQKGIDVITIDPPRKQRFDHAYHPAHLFHPERLLAQMTCRIVKDAVNIYGEDKDFDQVDGAGHSMGGPGVVHSAKHCPGLFRSVTIWGPAGASEHDTVVLAKRIPRVVGEAIQNRDALRNHFGPRNVTAFGRYIASNLVRTASEAIAVSNSDIAKDIAYLDEIGIATGAIIFLDDGFFKPDEIAARVRHVINFWHELKLGHIGPQTDPDLVADEQVKILQKVQATN